MLEFGGLSISWIELVDISLVAVVFYQLILLIRGTRALSAFTGLIFIVLIFYFSGELGLSTLHWLLGKFLGPIFLVIVILFQQDIRNALSQFGAGRLWKRTSQEDQDFTSIIAAALAMAEKRIGALIVIEKHVPLGDLVERGVAVDARISKELLQTIFYPDTALHDGAVIVRGKRIMAAGCILPLAVGVKFKQHYGTRHRAALGITQESDAVALVVSEERGEISVAVGGRLTGALDEVRLKRVMRRIWSR
ncbi:diadenylate cyclase CdaA [Desulfobaculum bizertense]|uniref:Diadenylate cyclase n=1 Tax=Desulfobaculum bizertense DSM 18034 TaxID=1121442 RepID=A0A1T4VKJ0_9BACT|nr:diadenylate cyclase CdaA [Desulfobaculum bizertense]UIJ38066.1 diadenylate cyclase CdaA [Desulfobaculum bizertense]SKA65405.1 TIGR00159 family protein [Desulfobaculum bizertense DSM 18034]